MMMPDEAKDALPIIVFSDQKFDDAADKQNNLQTA
jgi:hypothetical protein